MSNSCDARTVTATLNYRIDPMRDRLLALRRLVDWHERRTGERVHRSVPYRWAQRGIRGIRLPTTRIGGVRYTSEEAIRWWTAAVDCADGSLKAPPTIPSAAMACPTPIKKGQS